MTRLHHSLAMTKVGVIGFGGGSALIPVMEKELVAPERLNDAEFVQDTVIANITPGALPVKIASLSGLQLNGIVAACLAGLAVALPGAVGTVALLAVFSLLGPGAVAVVEFASLGVSAFILYLLAHYVAKVVAPGGRVRPSALVIAVAAFVLSGAGRTIELGGEVVGTPPPWVLPELSALGLVLLSLVVIAMVTLWQMLRGVRHPSTSDVDGGASATRPPGARRAITAAGVLATVAGVGFVVALAVSPSLATVGFLGLVLVSTVSSFGGGEAYVGVADGFFVASGLVDATVFYGQIVPVANALPGPILVKIASGVSYAVGLETGSVAAGIVFATASFLITVGSCAAIALLLFAGYDRARDSVFVRNISAYILPVICGLLASTAVSLLHAGGEIAEGAGVGPVWVIVGSILLAAAVPLMRRIVRVPDVVFIAVFAAISLAALSLM
ncbi:chromate transporter [Microbacterium sp. NPDC077184]|uniref:chromate transporter n=1 Tax=Microbacterium sp. NPDC077184 TaxID=3154764 RepID=UPI00343462C3